MLKIAPVIFMAFTLLACSPADQTVRVATFNIAMGLEEAGAMAQALSSGDNDRLQQVAEILQRVRPDIVLLNEFDFDPDVDAAALFNRHYLAQSLNGQPAIQYPYHFRAPVNTGEDSGLDLDGDGRSGGPGDAWGFGHFPGQFGMLVLSRYPIDLQTSRSFQFFPWSSMPDAMRPVNEDGTQTYTDEIWRQLRLASKSYWDLALDIDGRQLHLLVFHPTPPVFDGPADRNGKRNHDEVRFWAEYLRPDTAEFIIDDQGQTGGLASDQVFVIAGDFNADAEDGDSIPGTVAQLLDHQRINSECIPASEGAIEASLEQGGLNLKQVSDPKYDTSDFNDEFTGNLRLDYLLPAKEIPVIDCGVFWPAKDQIGHELIEFSDHRLVWLDIAW